MVFTLRDGKVDAVKERNVIKADGKSFFFYSSQCRSMLLYLLLLLLL